jgi:hypothetical protein
MKALDPGRLRLAIAGGLLAILAGTNQWLGWVAGWRLVSGHDEPIYKQMALAAPHLPRLVPNQHAEEFPLVYVVGLISHVLGVNVDYVFRAVAYLVILGICVVLHALLTQARVSTPIWTLCMAVFVLNTYALRYYLIVPGYFLDVTFVLAIAIVLYALIGGRYWLAVAGIVLAALVRQTAVPTALALGWWVAFGREWRDAPNRTRAYRGVGIIVIPVAVYIALIKASASFAIPETPGIAGLTILGDLEHLPSTLGALAEHVVRVANSLFAVGSLTGVALYDRRRSGIRAKLPFEFVGCFVVGCSIALQALALNTNYSGHPERLTVLSLVAFVTGLAYLMREREQSGFKLPGATAAAMVAVLAVGSLQYLFTWFGPSTAVEGAILQLVAAIVVGWLLWGALGGRRLPAAARLGRSL